MGLFGKKLPVRDFTIEFGSEYVDSMTAMVRNSEGNYVIGSCFINFPSQLLSDIEESVSNHQPIGDVLYSDEKQFLEVVGESFHHDAIQELVDDIGIEQWTSGFLMPEPFNAFDSNAVAVLLLFQKETEKRPALVGYLAKDQAKKVQKSVLKQLNMGAVIPLLAMVKGGSPDKPNYGILARAMTKKVKF